jgi:iron(III) transport system substrate-binding protein
LEANVPPELRDPGLGWWALTTRVRVPVVSTERVPEGAVTSYEDLGDPQYRGRTCLRTSNNEYNQSFVADRIAKDGLDATRALLESWMANDPQIINSDGELLAIMADGQCDVGLSNHYYLGRALEENPDFPVAPAWPDQDGRGAHANVSGAGVVTWSDQPEDAVKLLEWLTSAPAQEELVAGSEFPANPSVPPAEHIRDWAGIKLDPIAYDEAGPLLDDAIELMLDVGWN